MGATSVKTRKVSASLPPPWPLVFEGALRPLSGAALCWQGRQLRAPEVRSSPKLSHTVTSPVSQSSVGWASGFPGVSAALPPACEIPEAFDVGFSIWDSDCACGSAKGTLGQSLSCQGWSQSHQICWRGREQSLACFRVAGDKHTPGLWVP